MNMPTDLSPRYNPKETEDKWIEYWQKHNLFHAKVNPDKKPFTIVIPPPNVTGILHMGHALNNTLQDILIRYKRMKGFETCWMPGTDHAGIATQNVVEKQLAKEGRKRQDLGREEFLKRLWDWKQQYGDTIIQQLIKLGASCDWQRTRFTMDDEYSAAVKHVFVKLYEKGLIYQAQYIINWCPRCQTALSDEEAEHQDTQGSLYHIRYPFKDNPQEFVIVATTRPETMLGDTAVAVNLKDKRYKKLIGKILVLPLLNREIKIIADSFVDPKFGTGAVKVTPAHDPNDFEMGKRHNLEFINILHPNAVLNDQAGRFKGMDRFVGRKAVIEALQQDGLLEKIEPHHHAVGHCYRCHTVVEPYLSKQWFVKMQPLAKPALDAVKKGKVKFYPTRWTKVYLNWMENIRDWCISRQIWWGHRIPVWTLPVHDANEKGAQELLIKYFEEIGERKNVVLDLIDTPNELSVLICTASNKAEKAIEALNYFYQYPPYHSNEPEFATDKARELAYSIMAGPAAGQVSQDPDVLDTWFSSWLWPFATFYWPPKNKDLQYFYPGATLFTASEIIFFWVARMIMAGLEFMGGIPFAEVYIHGTVRDAKGRKMSKSIGNAIDPLEIINEYGTDALRFSLILNSGEDLFISKEKFEVGRNFANKIWNAARLILMNVDSSKIDVGAQNLVPLQNLDLPSRWILSRLQITIDQVNKAIEKYRFSEAENFIYDFFWKNFCDWYLEIVKDRFNDKNIQAVLLTVLRQSLQILHPFMPFVTEEIQQKLPNAVKSLSTSPWPAVNKKLMDKSAEEQMLTIIELISLIRNTRARWNIQQHAQVDCLLEVSSKTDRTLIKESISIIKILARVNPSILDKDSPAPKECGVGIVSKIKYYIPLTDIIDIQKEKTKILEQIEQHELLMQGLSERLKNKEFLKNAPQEVVAKEKTRLESLQEKVKDLKKTISDLN